MEIKPYKKSTSSKKEQVALMFNNIAKRYDFLNHFLSLGIDKIWRRKTINQLEGLKPELILDVATGTADLAIEALKLQPKKITGIDISTAMLEIGKKKIEQKNYDSIELIEGDSENLQFENKSFNAVTVAFGVRNFENRPKGLSEMYRILKPGGKAVILEFSKPTQFPVKQIYNLYFNFILPAWGKFFSKDNSAYSYLPESVNNFPNGQAFLDELEKAGFINTKSISLTFGIACIYSGEKVS
ncbi:MAG: bifunctional demethylmenaquinone methyltransferase/2-methoxy-6-polyprenyl-1,4-benzoquinol methylase UbiE [Chlorobi bacterium]|nr:bifunctional demethylmenaquinone methyltransferase/2-methoxy-6-polyprenyl-1,4-benzoquinol methylase UbiE [Chlorobiota bacterium]